MNNFIKNKEKDNLITISNIILQNIKLFDNQQSNNLDELASLINSSADILNVKKNCVIKLITIFFLISFKKYETAIDDALKLINTIDAKNDVINLVLKPLKTKNYKRLAYNIAHHSWGLKKSMLPLNWQEKPIILIKPNLEDIHLANKFNNLANLPSDTLGWLFYHHTKQLKIPFPGEKNGSYFQAVTPHDSLHVLTGYSASLNDEMLLGGFSMGMSSSKGFWTAITIIMMYYNSIPLYSEHAPAGLEIFPMYQWLQAYIMGLNAKVDVFSKQWDFWKASFTPIDRLRYCYNITPVI